jgi:site-specific recombinase XerD
MSAAMTNTRQLPLFPDQPQSVDDLNLHTPIKHTLALFQSQLMQDGKTEHTVKAFTSDFQLLMERTGDVIAIGEIDTAMLHDFLRWLEYGRGVSCSRKSYARRVTTLKVYFKWLHSVGAIAQDPAIPILQRSGQAPLSEILDEREIEIAYAYADTLRIAQKPDVRPSFLLRLLTETGIKKSETERLKPDDIIRLNYDEGEIVIKRASAKDIYKERRIAINRELLGLYAEYQQQYRPKETVFNCTTRNLEYILEAIGVGAGLDKKPSFEMLRWTSAVRQYIKGEVPDTIREQLGLSAISWIETFSKIKRLAGEDDESEAEDDAE